MNFQQNSGRHNNNDVSFQSRLDFNTSKGGVDEADEMLHACSILGSIPKVATCCIVQPVGHCGTGCKHHLKICASNNSKRDFIIKLAESCVQRRETVRHVESPTYCI